MNCGMNLGVGLTIAVMSLSPSIQAELILLEQFDYEGTDAPLNGSDGGVGFESAWEVVGWSRPFDIGRTIFAAGDGVVLTVAPVATTMSTAGDGKRRCRRSHQEAHPMISRQTAILLTATLVSFFCGLLAAQSSDLPDPDGKPASGSHSERHPRRVDPESMIPRATRDTDPDRPHCGSQRGDS